MIVDALIKVKDEADTALTLRRSCRERWWNMFDTLVVLTSIVEALVNFFPGGSADIGVSAFRTCRAIRIVRLFRVAGKFTVVRNFKTMFYSIMDSGSAFLSALIMPFVIMFVYAVLFLSLIPCASLGVMGILNGIFVNAAIRSSRLDRELATANILRERSTLVQQIMSIFLEDDVDKSGTLSWSEFEFFLDDDEVKAYVIALDLDMASLGKIFDLLDTNGTGELDLMDFLDGCMRLEGVAKTIDVVLLRAEVDRLLTKL